jgi:hypothetical protein
MGRHSIPDSHDDGANEPDAPAGDGSGEIGFRLPDDWSAQHGDAPREPRRPGQDPSRAVLSDDDLYNDDLPADSYRTESSEDADVPEASAVTGTQSVTQGLTTGSHRTFADGEWTGSHRAIIPGRRKVSGRVIAALVTVVVVVGVVIGWRFFGSALSDRSTDAAARCVSGSVAVPVVVDPSILDQVNTLAGKYNQSAAPVGDKCVKVGVKAADPDAVLAGFTGQWPNNLGARPAVWIPASSVSQARLITAAGDQIVSGESRSLATSPVVIAVRPQLKDALSQQNWGTLPALQTNPAGLDGLNLPGWGSLRLALPTSGNGDATYLAAEAVAAAAVPGAPVNAGVGAVHKLLGAAPKLADTNVSTALDALISAKDPASAPVHAVVTTEQQLYQRAQHTDGAKDKLAAWLPPGPPAMANYPVVLLGGEGLSQEQISAASEFERFLHKPDQLAALAKAGFRTDGGSAPHNDVVNLGSLATPLSVGDVTARATLANAVGGPSQASAVVILLDQSLHTDEDGKSRLAHVIAGLQDRIKTMAPTSSVGLWTFDGVAGRSEVPLAPLGDAANNQSHAAALISDLDDQSASSGGAVSFTTLRLLYGDLVSNYRDGQANSILVITRGPHTDQSMDGQGLQDYIKSTFDQAHPVAVNVIDFGSDPDQSTWAAVAQLTGGNYQNAPNASGHEFTTALAGVLN